MALGGEDKKYGKGYVKATKAKAPVTGTADEFGSQAMWDAAAPNLTPALQLSQDAGLTAGGLPYYQYAAGANDYLNEATQSGTSQSDAIQQFMDMVRNGQNNNSNSNGSGSGVANRGSIIDALRARLKADPYASMAAQLQKNYQQAQTTGEDTLGKLRAALGGMKNAYDNVNFATPIAASNPLAAYMQASGAGTGEVDALQQWLGSLAQNAASADKDMVRRLQASTQQDIAGRRADVGSAEAAWRQALANQMQSQQAAIEQAKAARNEDILMQLAQMGAKP